MSRETQCNLNLTLITNQAENYIQHIIITGKTAKTIKKIYKKAIAKYKELYAYTNAHCEFIISIR
jgi:hypothetical protein